ncbi:hypothetical protein [Pseudoalteromonas sp. S1688]|uniref:hypothetical protein n=1 Tax=Pseudoalteromonas sp. S1688 TaxID=579511 RepID=UPI00110AE10C|nr:hypothetical protein [Pseudoalteromonas sp. S1688]TMP48709.1 hypothetical protein CWB81_15950 [Pseudoalteromonas sp. S1688]
MPKIVYAPILEQAGFLKRKAAVVVEQWVAQLDGATQYWQLSEEISVPDGGSIELDLMYDSANQSEVEYVLTSELNTDTSLFFTSREVLSVGPSGYIPGILVDGVSAVTLPYDDTFHTIKCIASGGLTKVGILASRFNYTRTSSGTIKMFRVRDSNGVVVNEIPLTNKAQGATQLATVGNVNAFMPNYTDAVWRKP